MWWLCTRQKTPRMLEWPSTLLFNAATFVFAVCWEELRLLAEMEPSQYRCPNEGLSFRFISSDACVCYKERDHRIQVTKFLKNARWQQNYWKIIIQENI